ncbi:SUMF1/EgtB/PvdO family nonheme iron enzyme [Synechococcales cyanobacterium C]|uniref:SUMF1/EgtB/PvdO family nonheme iron enzyme n=1 Tax=Petrachloros mirabilis ULC683 TaxID=2781853 RepID=A0A8K1ZXV3_9CYAN|nr:bifunctional serine/threonine-protein kinase/formylglycine-generating enzyme family protein [Petrachloros mirabilis]NCJ06011.1 SUMF1/EgtB/PvdO family nonheme iron enzyme [Petrachloros mirabilis ULC683]
MICCLNPDCPQPRNPDYSEYCQQCGTPLVKLLRYRYRIYDLIGQGGFGRTYLAEDTDKLNEKCVVKQFAFRGEGSYASQKARELFAAEARKLQELGNHAQIPALYAYFTVDERQYLVQQWIEGQNLLTEVKQSVFCEDQIRQLLLDLLPVLSFIHERGVVHRDIKPENLMRQQQDGRLMLIDFGVAKTSTLAQMAVTGTTLGSQGYSSKEQLLEGKATSSSDLFSLGATCFHLLTGHPPFQLFINFGYSWVERWQDYVQSPVSAELTTVISKLLQAESQRRYQSAAEVLAALGSPLPTASRVVPASLLTAEVSSNMPAPVRPSRSASTPTLQPISPEPVKETDFVETQSTRPSRRTVLIGLGSIGFMGTLAIGATINVINQLGNQSPTEEPQEGGLGNPGESPPNSSEPSSEEVLTVDAQGQIIERRPLGRIEVYQEDLGNGVSLDLVAIPGGTFLMGSPDSELGRDNNESPQHEVRIPPFWMGQYAITQAQWRAVAALPQVSRALDPDPANFKGANRPVEDVSLWEAVEFCNRLSVATDIAYRLPSEAEWEYACRAGTTTPFHYGDTLTDALANYDATDGYANGPTGRYREQTTEVGSFPPNALGLYDMHGNVWEWCADHWHDNYIGVPTDGAAWLTDNDNHFRLLRGGSWLVVPRLCRSANRFRYGPGVRFGSVGFRVVSSSVSRTS